MRRTILLSAILTVAVLAACGSDGGPGAVTKLPKDTFGYIDGSEDGKVKYPVLEFWNIPVCRCDHLIDNTPHGTRVKVLAKKTDCKPAQYEVEILEGEKEGVRGWVAEGFVSFEKPPGVD